MVVIPADTNVPADAVVNTWGFSATAETPAALESIRAALDAFYTGWQTFRSSKYVWDQTRLKVYDLSQATPRVPIFDEPLQLQADAAPNTLPQEVALCMSFQGERLSGLNQARRRGRIYLGPFGSSAADTTGGRPSNSLITGLAAAAGGMYTASEAAIEWKWGVISEADATPGFARVRDGWIDNAWDTQRRRGEVATARTPFGA